MSCKNNTPNVNKTFIIEPLSLTGGTPVLSACTSMYTNLIQSCSGDTTITLGTGLVTFNSNINGIQSITATTIEATTYLSGGTNILDIINSNDTFVTGGTFSDIGDSISLVRNDGANIIITGLTNFYTTGGTYDNSTALITFNRNDQLSAFTVDLSSIDVNDTFVTGTTLSGNILTLERNDGVDLTTDLTPIVFSGGAGNCITDLYVTNIYGCSPITIKDSLIISGATNLQASSFYNLTVSGSNPSEITNVAYVTGYVQTNEIYATGGTYNSNILTINRNDGGLFNVTITGITDTFVTAATLNSTTLELDRNEGLSTLSVDLLPVLSGKTNLSLFNTYTGNTQIILDTKVESGANLGGANEIFSGKSGTTLVFNTISGGSNTTITQVGNVQKIDVAVPPSENTFVTGGTYNSSTDIITFNNNSGGTFNVTGITDTFVSGVTFNNGNYQLTTSRNDSTNFVTDLSILSSDVKVTGGTYNINTGVVTFRNNSGGTFDVTGFTSGMTDSYTTTAKTSGTLIQFDNNLNGPNFYSVDLTPIISGKTDVTLFDSHTGNTSNPHNVTLTQLSGVSETLFNTYTGNTQIILDTKVENGLNVGGANEIFSGKSGTTLIFRTISGGSNTTITQVGDIQKIDVAVPPSENTFVTGGTYNDSTNTLSLNRNDAITVDITGVTDNFVVAGSYSDSTDTISLLRQDGSFVNITGVTDTFTTGSTYDNGTALATFTKNDGTTYTLDLSTIDVNDTFSTGFTYNDANTLTISRNDGVDLSTSINTMTGLTVNGTLVVDTLSATTYTGLTLNDLDDVTTNIPSTPDNSYQGELVYFDVTSNQWVSGEEYGNLGEVTIWGKKGSAGTIDKGCPVYIVGFDDDIHEVELANATTATTMPVIGFTAEDFDNAGVYPIITFGKITGLDTSSATTVVNPFGETWEVNDVLYMAKSDGGLTKFRPSGTDTQIQRIAKVLKVGTTDGQLFIFNTARTAGLPNLTTDYLWVGNGNDTPQELIRTDVGITTTGFTYNNNNTFTITDDNGGSLSSTINQMSGLTVNGDLDVTGDTTLGPLTATSVTSNSAINVFNGHINIRDNSYFLQGRTVADANVSLIGVDNQDRVFVGNAGYDTYIDSDTIVDGTLSAQTVFLTTTPTLNNSATDILVRNSSTGEVEYRPVSGITPNTDTFVTGTTFGSNQATVTRNDGTDVLLLTGGTKVTLSNPSTNQIKIDVTPELNIVTVSTTTYTATIDDEIIGVDTSSNAVTITLPDSLSSGTLRYEIKDIGFNSRSNPITIQAVGSDSIRTTSLVSSFTLSADGGAVVLINTATREWWQM